MGMSRVESLLRAVKALDEDELSEFRAWFGEYDAWVGINSSSVISEVGASTISLTRLSGTTVPTARNLSNAPHPSFG